MEADPGVVAVSSRWDLAGVTLFEFIERGDSLRELRFFDQHHGKAVADWICKPADFGNQEFAFLAELAERERATKHREELRVERVRMI